MNLTLRTEQRYVIKQRYNGNHTNIHPEVYGAWFDEMF